MTFREIQLGTVIIDKEGEFPGKIIIVTGKELYKIRCIYIRILPTFIDINFGYNIESWIFDTQSEILNNAVDASDEERSKEFRNVINKLFTLRLS